MRIVNLLAPNRARQGPQPHTHHGQITTDIPNEMWGTDATSSWTAEGVRTIFLSVDHRTGECIGLHAARRGTSFEALEPIRQGVREQFGGYDTAIRQPASAFRHDHGSHVHERCLPG